MLLKAAHRSPAHTRLARALTLAGILLASAAPTTARDPVAEAAAAAQATLASADLPALAVAVGIDGELLWEAAYGTADLQGSVAATPATRFRIGSVSKAITSVGLGLLVERGAIDLDGDPRRWVAVYPRKAWPMTLRQVAAHTSGIPHYRGADFVNHTPYATATAAVAKFADRDLLFEPGTRFAYSSFGWNLLGAAIEGASGQPFVTYMEHEVLRPMGLLRTVSERRDVAQDDVATHYGSVGTTRLVAPPIEPGDAWPSGGFLSTAGDLVIFGQKVLADALLQPTTRRELWAPASTSAGEPTGYGLGWEHRTIAGRAVVGHGGSHVGATAELWIWPTNGLVVAVLTNTNAEATLALVEQLAGAFLEEPP